MYSCPNQPALIINCLMNGQGLITKHETHGLYEMYRAFLNSELPEPVFHNITDYY